MTDANDIVKEFIKDLEAAVRATMISKGMKAEDDVVKTIQFKEKKEGLFEMIANDYYLYQSTGRRAGARKVPISDLITWIKEKGIGFGNINSLAFAIQTSIYKNGIKGKNYIDPVEEVVADTSEVKLADGLEEALLEAIDKTF